MLSVSVLGGAVWIFVAEVGEKGKERRREKMRREEKGRERKGRETNVVATFFLK